MMDDYIAPSPSLMSWAGRCAEGTVKLEQP
jgi:hypothetical protein